ncbi:dTMP kinase [Leptospirillum ferriphilum]|jgi:dTMP kinase|uniref:Thymidylate kinase n=2 Tax=Leptospirillum TaxID=179 RepID=A0A094WDS2_9BACT|nr:dTMP kinase [Leptospirillum ferriphilum]EDZ40027.1 MAG: Thymidylate kinase [Leptospirillum sp. Group II '5-way CG']KGA94655.1 Thymidylate kinase [Leptospirillum ferriphilum]MCL5259426.1 dTMP kinase [Nitrospirota bacterium]
MEKTSQYPGTLIAIEGTDGSGKTTQSELLKHFFESRGQGVVLSPCNTAELIRGAISKLKERNTLDPVTFCFLYAADFVDRFEHVIIPALASGKVVIAEQYVYTVFARAMIRGIEQDWIRKMFDFALTPARTFYLDVRFEDLLNRIQWKSRDERYFDYYEAGMDLNLANRKKDSFVIYQKRLIEIYREMALSDGFETVDAMKPIQLQQLELRQSISQILRNRSRRKGSRS